jgi:hypothetical protein
VPVQQPVARCPVQDVAEAVGTERLDPVDQRGLGERGTGHDGADHPGVARGEQTGQHAEHRSQPAVEGELAEQRRCRAAPVWRHVRVRGEHATREGQVEGRARLAQRGRAQRQHDPLVGPHQPGVDDGRAHAVARLLQRRVRQPQQVDAREPAPDVGLDLHHVPVDAAQRDRPPPCEPHQKAPS